jgi:hypothetical protein
MEQNVFETIIIGAGVAGLGCAHTLQEANRDDFLVITEDIGGRIRTSEDGKINYGAYFVCNDYHHVLKHVKISIRMKLRHLEFHNLQGKAYSMWSSAAYPLQFLKMLWQIIKFRKAFYRFRKTCEQKSQKEAFDEYPELQKLYWQKADGFIAENGIEDIARRFFSRITFLFFFVPLSELSAFDFMRTSMGLLSKSYEFDSDEGTLTKGFQNQIIKDSVIKIKQGAPHLVETASGKQYHAENIVLATPPDVSQKLLGLPQINKSPEGYVFHLKGKIKPAWSRGQYELFPSGQDTVGFGLQRDGSILFCSLQKDPDFEEYFEAVEIIKAVHWESAFSTSCEVLLDAKQGSGVYMAGDFNFSGLEDSFISGIFAANQVIKNA